ncbi:MAG TPA: phage tail length tape measure family protein, partial [Pseudorhizobium sp.]|nr:phage tail length tape measure family protein [Pseudorhizobium sp.]
MTVASLGFKIDSSPASSAALDLDKLTAAANRTQMAADKLEAETAALGSTLGKAGQGARGAQAPVEALGRSFGTQDDHVRAFRMEIERLTLKFQPIAQASKAYEAAVGEINRAHQLGVINAQQMQRALEAERQAFERLRASANSANQAVTAANQNSAAGGMGQRLNAANVGYQFQDIAVTAAMGMNPLMIGLQQGTQLASVIATMERPVAGLASAFASLVNPVSLITIGLTAGTAALAQYFLTGSSGSDGMSEDLAEQIDLIAKVAERWGDATPRLKAYADEAVRMAEANERLAAGNALAAAEFEKVEDVLGTINAEYTAAIRSLRGYGEDAAPIVQNLTTRFSELQTKIQEGKATTDDLTRVQNALSEALEAGATPAVQKLLDVFTALVPQIQAATDAAAEFRKEGSGSVWPDLGTLPGLFSDGGRMYSPNDFIPRKAPVPQRRPRIELGEGWTPSREGASIVNSDGRLVSVPVPGGRPNYFEREADLPQFSRTNRNTNWGRDVLQEEMRRQ